MPTNLIQNSQPATEPQTDQSWESSSHHMHHGDNHCAYETK